MRVRTALWMFVRTLPLLALVTCGGTQDGPSRTFGCDHSTTIRVVAAGVRHDEGEVRVALFDSKRGFPGEPEHALQRGVAALQGETATFSFAPAPCGTYAVSVFHDEDGDGEMKRDWLGRPAEGWGVSNDATGSFGPPSFEDAAFEAEGDTFTVHLNLRY